jgi:hypothetical protein
VSRPREHARDQDIALTRIKIRGLGENLPLEIALGSKAFPLKWRWQPQLFILKVLREQSNYRFKNVGFGAYFKPSKWIIWCIFRLIRNGINPFEGFISGRGASLTAATDCGIPNFCRSDRSLRLMRTTGKNGLLLNDYTSFLEVQLMRQRNNPVITDFTVFPRAESSFKAIPYSFFTTLLPILLDRKLCRRTVTGIVSQLPSWHPYRISFRRIDSDSNLVFRPERATPSSEFNNFGLTQMFQGKNLVLKNARSLFGAKSQILNADFNVEPEASAWPTYIWRYKSSDCFHTPGCLDSEFVTEGTYISSVNNLYHFVEETLPQIEINNLSSSPRTIFLGGNIDPILEELTVSASNAPVVFVRDEEQFSFEDLLFFRQNDFRSYLSSGAVIDLGGHPGLIKSVLNRVHGSYSKNSALTRKIYIVRRNGLQRKLVNFKALESALKKRGFIFIDFEGLTLQERISILDGCAVLVGESGAGLAHAYFLNPKAKVLEIRHPQMTGSLEHLTLSLTTGLQYLSIDGFACSSLDKFAHGKDSFRADVDSVVRMVEEW